MISEQYAASNSEKAISEDVIRRSVAADRLNVFCSNCGTIKKNHSNTITSGMERQTVTYASANQLNGRIDERHIIARMEPHTIPTSTPVSVISRDTTMPSPSTLRLAGLIRLK